MSGSVALSLDRPTHEQKEAETKVRAVLFDSNTSVEDVYYKIKATYEQKEMELAKKIHGNELTIQTLFPSKLTDEEKHLMQQKEEDIKIQLTRVMLASPMFAEKFEDNILPMNLGTGQCIPLNNLEDTNDKVCSIQDVIRIVEAADAVRISSLEEFFPEPLQPFSF